MRKILFLPLFVIWGSSAHAAEVVFMGTDGVSDAMQAPYKDFSAKQRVKDLFDFNSFGEYGDDRSGMITGTVETSFEYDSVSGNRTKSFYEDSDPLHQIDLNLNIYEKLWSNYKFEGIVNLRHTRNERVEDQEAIRLKQLNLKVTNPENLFEFGNFYSDFSRFTMGTSLEGFNAEVSPKDSKISYKTVVGRLNEAERGQNQRNVLGGNINFKPFAYKGTSMDTELDLGFQSVLVRDDGSTALTGTSATPDLYNLVTSMDGEWRNNATGLASEWEVGVSQYDDDEDNGSSGQVSDLAVSFSPSYRYKNKFDIRYLYYRVGPDFYTSTGSAVRDKEQHQINMNYKFSPSYRLSATHNWYWDNLPGSTKTKRTQNYETNVSLMARPFEKRNSLSLKPYVKRIERDSDDVASSSSAETMVYGFSINDTIKEASVGTFAEYRDYDDLSGSGNSEEYMRYGMNFSRDFKVYEKPLYLSASYTGSVRDPQSESDNEVQNGLSFNGRLKVKDSDEVSFGHNFLLTSSAGNIDDYDTNTSFIEYSHKLMNKHNTELKLRGERNDYNFEDNTEDYQEARFIATLVTQF